MKYQYVTTSNFPIPKALLRRRSERKLVVSGAEAVMGRTLRGAELKLQRNDVFCFASLAWDSIFGRVDFPSMVWYKATPRSSVGDAYDLIDGDFNWVDTCLHTHFYISNIRWWLYQQVASPSFHLNTCGSEMQRNIPSKWSTDAGLTNCALDEVWDIA